MKQLSLLLFLVPFLSVAQEATPSTQTAYLTYDYRFRTSGYEEVASQPINMQPQVPGLVTVPMDSSYDYVFFFCSDSTTGGVELQGELQEDKSLAFRTADDAVYKEMGSKVIVYTLTKPWQGTLRLKPMLIGNKKPFETGYYLIMRKKRTY